MGGSRTGIARSFGGVNPTGSNIAHFAHLGGVVAGLLLAIYWKKTNHRNYR